MKATKYKVGDKVRIKAWKAMEKEFGTKKTSDDGICIACKSTFIPAMETSLISLDTDRIVTIKERFNIFYTIEEIEYKWSDDMIQEIAVEREKEKISRFELMDI